MSRPRMGAKRRASAAPAQAPAHRPAENDDQDVPLGSGDDHSRLLEGAQSLSIEDAQSLAIVDELDGDAIGGT